MTQEELDQIILRAQKGEATLSDVVEIVAAILMSVGRHSRDIKAKQDELQQQIDGVSSRLARVESHTSDWLYRAVVEDPLEDVVSDPED